MLALIQQTTVNVAQIASVLNILAQPTSNEKRPKFVVLE
jgi:hypothetical protein